MLCLPPPYGWPDGVGLTMIPTGPVSSSSVSEVLLGYGCPPPAAVRYAGALASGGPISCRVRSHIARLDYLPIQLADLNVQIEFDVQP